LAGLLTNPNKTRLDAARQGLADAGFAGAHIERGQTPSNMARCDVGQIRKRGSAYAWSTPTAEGVFCLPEDGRPSRVIVNHSTGSDSRRASAEGTRGSMAAAPVEKQAQIGP
jgi:hypothetical protein